MKIVEKTKALLAKIVAKMEQVTTDKGVLTYDGELEVGKDVYSLAEDGNISDAEDGEYKLEDGTILVVADSRIAEIRKPDGETTEEVEAAEEIADDVDIHNLAAEVERIKEELAHKKEEIAELKDRVSALEGKSDTVEEAMRKMSAAKLAKEEIKGEESSVKKFRNDHEKMLYELNKAR